MFSNAVFAAIVALCSVSVALLLSPWNTASLETTENICATASTVREKCLNFSLQEQWENKFSANIQVLNTYPSTRVYDGRILRKGDVIQIKNYFGCGRTTVKENSEKIFALQGTRLGTTAAHTWEFVSERHGITTMLVHRETWTGGLSFLFMRFGPVRPLLEEMFTQFNSEVKDSAQGPSKKGH